MRLNTEETLALCIDYQEKLMPAINDSEQVLNKTAILVKGLRALGVPIIVTQQYTKGLGGTVEPVKSALGEYKVFDKTEFCGYDNSEIRDEVKRSGKKNILVFGAETHICALQTAIGLNDAGYKVVMVEDCCGSRRQADKDSGIKRAMCEGITVSCCETVLFELTAKAGTEEFKIISKLVK